MRFPTNFWVTLILIVIAVCIDVFVAMFSLNTALIFVLIQIAILVISLMGGLPLTQVSETNAKVVEAFGDYNKTLWNGEGRCSVNELVAATGGAHREFGIGTTIVRLDELYLHPECLEDQKLVSANETDFKSATEGEIRTVVYYKRPQTKRSFRQGQIFATAEDLVLAAKERQKFVDKGETIVLKEDEIFIRVAGREFNLSQLKTAIDDANETDVRKDFLETVNGGFFIKRTRPRSNKINTIPILQDVVIQEAIGFFPVPCEVLHREKSEAFIGGGLAWIGLWPIFKVKQYHFTWMSLQPDNKLTSNNQVIQEIRLRDDLYIFKIPKVEVSVELQVELTLSLKIRIMNPYRAMYNIEKWLESIHQLVVSEIRTIIGEMSWREVLAAKRQIGDKLSNIILRRLCNPKGEDVERRYGIRILVVNVFDIDPVGVDAAVSAPFVAEQKRIARVLEARGEAEAVTIAADAKKEAIHKVNKAIQEYGDLGSALEYLEAIKKLGEKEGKVILLPAPDYVKSILSGVTLSKSEETK